LTSGLNQWRIQDLTGGGGVGGVDVNWGEKKIIASVDGGSLTACLGHISINFRFAMNRERSQANIEGI